MHSIETINDELRQVIRLIDNAMTVTATVAGRLADNGLDRLLDDHRIPQTRHDLITHHLVQAMLATVAIRSHIELLLDEAHTNV